MNRDELEKRNVGENLDALMNLDPRGYGVCRILYAGSRKATGEPLTMHAAQTLVDAVKPGDPVYILTGFVLLPHKVPEMDGMVSSMLLARALVLAFGAKPIIVCPEDSVQAVKNCAAVVGLHIYEDIADVLELPMSMGVQRFTKDVSRAGDETDALLAQGMPAAVISIEAPGANDVGVYHNAGGLDVSALEAKSVVLWEKLRALGVPSVAIGDLGNEIGMGKIADHIRFRALHRTRRVQLRLQGRYSGRVHGGQHHHRDLLRLGLLRPDGRAGVPAAQHRHSAHRGDGGRGHAHRRPQRHDRHDRLAAARHRRLQPEDERLHPQPDAPVHRLRAPLFAQFRPLVRAGFGQALF